MTSSLFLLTNQTNEPHMKGVAVAFLVATVAVAADVRCPSEWSQYDTFLAHKECHKYYMCDNGVPVEMSCCCDLYFNAKTGQCDWQANVDCEDRNIPGQEPSTYVTNVTADMTTAEPTAEPTTAETTTAEPTTAETTTAEPTTAEATAAEPATAEPTTAEPTTSEPTTATPTTAEPITATPTTVAPTTATPTTVAPNTATPTTVAPTTATPTTVAPTTATPTTVAPTTATPTTVAPTTATPTTVAPTTATPTTVAPTTATPTTVAPTTATPTTVAPTTATPTTVAPTTATPTTVAPTTATPTTVAPTTATPTTVAPTTTTPTTVAPTTATATTVAPATATPTTVTPTTTPTTASPTTVTPTTVAPTIVTTTTSPTTTTAEPITPAPGFLENGCPVNPYIHWLLPVEGDCNGFYYCVWGELVRRACPAVLHFNRVLQVCDWPANAGCDASQTTTVRPTSITLSTTTPITTTPTTTVTTPAGPTTPESGFQENGCPVDPYVHWLLPAEGDCNGFYYCVWGDLVQKACPEILHFNKNLQVCDWPANAGCDASVTTVIRPTTTQSTQSPDPGPITTEIPIPESGFLPNGCPVDPHVHWLLPVPGDCNGFYYCMWGKLILRTCPPTLHFNKKIQVCDWPTSAGCTTSVNKHNIAEYSQWF